MRKIKLLTVVMLSSLVSSSFANVNDYIADVSNEAKLQKKSISQGKLEKLKLSVLKDKQKHINFINKILNNTKQSMPSKKGGKAADGAVLFISFSMPTRLILSLSKQAAKFKIPVVLNGLVDGDFKKTMQSIYALQKAAKKEHISFNGVSIDPVWFEQFSIKAVPALVVTQRPAGCEYQKACADQSFDIVYGNTSIEKSLKLIAYKGEDAPLVARRILRGSHD